MPLFSMADVPSEKIAFKGRLASAEFVILLLSIRLPSFPVLVPVLKKTIPLPVVALFATISEPLSVQYLTVFVLASFIKRIVEVPAVVNVLVFVITRLFVLPVAFTLPSMVTLSAPFRSIKGVARFPLIESPVTVGWIFTEV